MTVEPYSFDQPAYEGCYAIPQSAMDKRHVFIMHEILMAWPFKHGLELGCYMGATATAFVEAMNAGSQMMSTHCDLSLTESLMSVLRNCKYPERVHISPHPSWVQLDEPTYFDFIFVDAAHDLDSVTLEVKKIQKRIAEGRGPVCIMAHDTSATENGWGKCEGAKYLKDVFSQTRPWIEDNKKRDGEMTHRGLFFATSDTDLYAKAVGVFNKWS